MQREKNVPYERASSKITERKTFEHLHTATPWYTHVRVGSIMVNAQKFCVT